MGSVTLGASLKVGAHPALGVMLCPRPGAGAGGRDSVGWGVEARGMGEGRAGGGWRRPLRLAPGLRTSRLVALVAFPALSCLSPRVKLSKPIKAKWTWLLRTVHRPGTCHRTAEAKLIKMHKFQRKMYFMTGTAGPCGLCRQLINSPTFKFCIKLQYLRARHHTIGQSHGVGSKRMGDRPDENQRARGTGACSRPPQARVATAEQLCG